MAKSSAKDFALFKETAQSWIERFGLKDWEVSFHHNDDIKDTRAACSCSDMKDRICYLYLSKTWQDQPTRDDIVKAAFHEVLELLYMPLRLYLSSLPGVSESFVDAEVHRWIRIFENTFLSPKVRRSALGK